MKRALITGAAKRIGREIAIHLSNQGWKVIVHYNTSHEEAAKLASEINGSVIQANLLDEHQLNQLFTKVEGPIDLLINNASVFEKSLKGPKSYDQFMNIFKVNFFAPIQLSMDYSSKYKGNIINVLDAASDEYSNDFIAYHLSKKGLEKFTKKFAHANELSDVRMNALAMGMCLLKEGQSKKIFEKIAKKYPSSIKDICQGIDYILSNNTLNGEILDLTTWK